MPRARVEERGGIDGKEEYPSQQGTSRDYQAPRAEYPGLGCGTGFNKIHDRPAPGHRRMQGDRKMRNAVTGAGTSNDGKGKFDQQYFNILRERKQAQNAWIERLNRSTVWATGCNSESWLNTARLSHMGLSLRLRKRAGYCRCIAKKRAFK